MAATANHKTTLLITLGGALTGLYKAVQAEDLVRTCLLTSIGTVVSFLLTLFLKRATRKWWKQ